MGHGQVPTSGWGHVLPCPMMKLNVARWDMRRQPRPHSLFPHCQPWLHPPASVPPCYPVSFEALESLFKGVMLWNAQNAIEKLSMVTNKLTDMY